MDPITEYQKECFSNYKRFIGYPESYAYLYGNPINVLVPIETTLNRVMIIGAYPSAKFFTIKGIRDVPVADNDAPFSNESYFDGSRVRTIPSGQELNDVILKNIGISRGECWITDLVKVFLFKEGHVKKYKDLGKMDIQENRSLFSQYADSSISWIEREIQICNPKVIILLGAEVTKAIFNVSLNDATSYLDGKSRTILTGGIERSFICLPHPGILMRHSENNPWPKRFEEIIAPTIREEFIKKKIKRHFP